METKREYKSMSLTECAKSDALKGLREKLTGWGLVCKSRTSATSKSQIRKHNRPVKATHHTHSA